MSKTTSTAVARQDEHDDLAPPTTLAECEAIIQRGIDATWNSARALLVINVSRLYLDTHATFEAYCQERWEIERSQAYRLIDAAKVMDVLSPIGDKDHLPSKESHMRELVPLIDDPELMREVWTEADTRADGKPTAVVIRQVRDDLTGETSRQEAQKAEIQAKHEEQEARRALRSECVAQLGDAHLSLSDVDQAMVEAEGDGDLSPENVCRIAGERRASMVAYLDKAKADKEAEILDAEVIEGEEINADETPSVTSNGGFGDGDAADARRLKVVMGSNVGADSFSAEDRAALAEYLTEDPNWSAARVAEVLNMGSVSPDNLFEFILVSNDGLLDHAIFEALYAVLPETAEGRAFLCEVTGRFKQSGAAPGCFDTTWFATKALESILYRVWQIAWTAGAESDAETTGKPAKSAAEMVKQVSSIVGSLDKRNARTFAEHKSAADLRDVVSNLTNAIGDHLSGLTAWLETAQKVLNGRDELFRP